MTREEVKGILKDISDEQLESILDLNSRDIGKAKGKTENQNKELEQLKKELAEKDQTIANLEKAKGDTEAIQKELDRYKQEEADRKKAEKEAQMDAILTQTAEAALDGKEFVNDFTRAHFVAELKKSLSDPANKGKKASELFDAMTKDVDGVFKNPQQEPMKIKRVDGGPGGSAMTKEQIMQIKDAGARQQAIAENIGLFKKG